MVSFCICYGKKRILFRIPVCDHGLSLSCEGRPDPKSAYGWYTVFFLVLMMLEEWIITQKIGESSHDMYLMTPLVTANLFLAAAFVPVGREWERLRKQCVNSQRKFSFAHAGIFLVQKDHGMHGTGCREPSGTLYGGCYS